MNTKPRTTRRRQMSVTDADYAILKELGDGNASQGLRNALHWAGVKPIPKDSDSRGVAAW